MKVPLNVGWLQEEGMLEKAADLLGYQLLPKQSSQFGTTITTVDTGTFFLDWEDQLTFTVAQLLKLGFEPGEFEYCPHCKRLQVNCDAEKLAIAEHNEGG